MQCSHRAANLESSRQHATVAMPIASLQCNAAVQLRAWPPPHSSYNGRKTAGAAGAPVCTPCLVYAHCNRGSVAVGQDLMGSSLLNGCALLLASAVKMTYTNAWEKVGKIMLLVLAVATAKVASQGLYYCHHRVASCAPLPVGITAAPEHSSFSA